MNKETRRRGRHRHGVAVTEARPRRWDLAKRVTAQHLDQIEPGWSIWYGIGARRFYAAATWTTPEPLLVQGRTVEELRGLMREAEQPTPVSHPSPRTPRPSRGVPMPETPGGLRTVCWDLPHDLAIVGTTRSMVNATLSSWALQDLADDVVLVVGELLANAIGYGKPPVRLSLWAETGELCVRVTDHGPEQPRHLDLGIDADHGRGLTIVDALAHETGITQLPDTPGKTVWARWHLSPQAAEASTRPSVPDPRTPPTP
ncbi:ATP-binding protein [Sphaerisporangium sp. NBC_01403]|uniref:ATP-binding protein n=1 Tax=Sphaerisporangium sp. NBC_01403 TaxID=2903599 RepID=UPI0032557389